MPRPKRAYHNLGFAPAVPAPAPGPAGPENGYAGPNPYPYADGMLAPGSVGPADLAWDEPSEHILNSPDFSLNAGMAGMSLGSSAPAYNTPYGAAGAGAPVPGAGVGPSAGVGAGVGAGAAMPEPGHAPAHDDTSALKIGGIPIGPSANLPSAVSVGGHLREPLPVVPDERNAAQAALGNEPVFHTLRDPVPPPSDTVYEVYDESIAGPDFMRLSMYNVPSSAKLRERTKLPLGLVARPFAKADVPLADFNGAEPPRCNRCRAYVNPAVQFTMGGTKFVCNCCNFVNNVPDYYYQATDPTGRRVDWEDRPELSSGTYDIVLPESYGQGHALRLLFLIDVSRDASRKQLPLLAAAAIRQALYGPNNKPGEGCLLPGVKVAIATFGSRLSFYRYNTSQNVEMLEIPELRELQIPPDVFVDPEETFDGISKLLDLVGEMFADVRDAASCFGTALIAARECLKETGGRVSAIMTTFPTTYPGKLPRRDPTVYNISETLSSDEGPAKELFLCTSPFYMDLADEYVKYGIGMDLFAFPTGYVDLTNIGQVAYQTGGAHKVYPQYVYARDARTFMADFLDVIAQPIVATQTQVKIRTSMGLQVEKLWGLDKPGLMDSHTVLAATVSYDGALDTSLDAQFQCAVLYTAPDGQRRVRVSNLPAGVTDQFKQVLKYVDADAAMVLTARQAVAHMYALPLARLRDQTFKKVYDIFGSMRAHAGGGLPPGQLLVPTPLRSLLPLSLALTKTPALMERSAMSDSRTISQRYILGANVNQLALYLYPRIYPLHELFDHEIDQYLAQLPMLRARKADLVPGGCYLLFNGIRFLLFVTQGTPEALAKDLLGHEKIDEVPSSLDELPTLDTDISRKARQLCQVLAERVGRPWLPLNLARQTLDGAEHHVIDMLIEDQHNGPGYLEFMQKIHHHSKTYSDHDQRWF